MGNRAGVAAGPLLAAAGYHPWNDAGERLGEWIIRRCDLGGLLEVMCHRRKVILLEQDRTKWERRCDLAHAIAHVDLAHRDNTDDKAEEAAVRLSAKRLIHRDDLARALRWTEGRATTETAELLYVDAHTLKARLTHLHPAERAFLRRELSDLNDMLAA